ncbi:MAG: cobalt ECF transporter T component CbiQ [Nitrospira bacterium HGW-Nitrospira-1]|nr:MAG: cobalt ECF transporter T component CbiQ [Nitrospira bacterium HGW-Nitrospira-1]
MEIFSEYIKKDHPLSQVDARVKLGVSLFILIMVLNYKGIAFPLLILCLSLILCVRIKVPLRVFLLRFSEPLFIAAVVILLKLLFSGQETMFSIKLWGVTITGHTDGLMNGLQIGSRIMGAVSVLALLGFSTPFTEIMAALSWLRMPKSFIEILMFAYRYIFMLLEDAMIIYNAQKNRLGYSNIRLGLSSFGTLAGSLTLKAFEHSQSATVAMVQRGYDGNMPMLKHKAFRFSEVAASVLLIITLGFVWKM